MEANTYATLRKPCGRWAQLPDVRRERMTRYAKRVLEHAATFVFMKRNPRFPRSNYAEDARLEYLARGMAGIIIGLSPMTAIERLRNMKHDSSGPLWRVEPGGAQYCACWRCSIMRSNTLGKIVQPGYENGLRFFMQLAATTKVPMEWSAMRSKRT